MPLLSAEPIKTMYKTGQRPVLVACNDFSDYVCKYANYNPANSLMTEWICACAANAAQLNIPPFSIPRVQELHFPPAHILSQIGKNALLKPLFGSKHIGSKHLDQLALLSLSHKSRKSKILDKDELLKIALFDIWIANEDRHQNNYNLLLNEKDGVYRFYVIDHGAAFNTQAAIDRHLTPLTFDETIINSPLFNTIYKKPRKFVTRITKTLDEIDLWQDRARQSLEQWCVQIPEEWGIDLNRWKTFLHNEWLSDNWKKETKQTFREHLQRFSNP
jgi:hypothetical protein